MSERDNSTPSPVPHVVGGQALRLVIEYDDLLRKYTGPIAGMTDSDNAAIDAAYDKMVAAARAAVEAQPAPAQHMMGYREGFEADEEDAALVKQINDDWTASQPPQQQAVRSSDDISRLKVQVSQYAYERDLARRERDEATASRQRFAEQAITLMAKLDQLKRATKAMCEAYSDCNGDDDDAYVTARLLCMEGIPQ